MSKKLRVALDELRPLAVVTSALLLITAAAYPLAVTGIAQALFHRQANGSIVTVNDKDAGSSLIGQSFTEDQYFHGRPSAAGAGYDASASSGSNLGPTNADLIHEIAERVGGFRASNGVSSNEKLPSDSVTASASGLDPHISPATARLQIPRVARARGVGESQIRELVDEFTDGRAFWFIGEPRVNVLELNIALDARFPQTHAVAEGGR